jgi:hypothetical protein
MKPSKTPKSSVFGKCGELLETTAQLSKNIRLLEKKIKIMEKNLKDKLPNLNKDKIFQPRTLRTN